MMKTVEELVKELIIPNLENGNVVISNDDIDKALGIFGINYRERQYHRHRFITRINNRMKKGIDVNEEKIYPQLWLNDRGKNYRIVNVGEATLQDSERTFNKAAIAIDGVYRALSKISGEDSYISPIDNRQIEFRGARPPLTQNELALAKAHLRTIKLFAPVVQTILGVASEAENFVNDHFGPYLLGHDDA